MPGIGKLETLSTADVSLDLDNPRIKWALEGQPNPTPQDVHLALCVPGSPDAEGAKFEQLRDSIKTNGGISSPIIVNRSNGMLVCIEGNTRLTLYRDFEKQGVAGNWSSIPALVYEDMAPADVHAIRLQAHLIGPRPWNPYAKAKYLDYLRNKERLPWNEIVDLCGGNRKDLMWYIDAYQDMEEFYRPLFESDENFDQTRFSGFVELQKGGVKQALQQANFGISDFASWIKNNKIKRLESVRNIPKVLKNPLAKSIFLKRDIVEAEKVLDRPSLEKTLRDADIGQLAEVLSQKLNTVPWPEVHAWREDAANETVNSLLTLRDIIGALIDENDLA